MISENNNYYYKIQLAYEIPFNVLDCEGDPAKVQARENLYEILSNIVPEDRYEKFSVKLVLYQLKDTFNYILAYDAFFRSTCGLPMEEYVEADKLKKRAAQEMEAYFTSQDCECKLVNIKTLV